MIRKANLGDEKACLELMGLAMSEIINKLGLSYEKLGELFRASGDKSRLSHSHIYVFTNENSQVLGAMGCYSGSEQAKMDAASGVKFEPECFSGELYVDFIAVFSQFRGRGVARALLKHAKYIAKDMGLKRVSLITDKAKNEKYYSGLGFKLNTTIIAYNFEFKHMIKEIS